jgi:4a-hydroxytetrahydrobiopterin dehydratase
LPEVSRKPLFRIRTRQRPCAFCDSLLSLEIQSDQASNPGRIMSELAERQCVPCRGGVPPLQGDEINTLSDLLPDWEVVAEHHLRREFKFKDFREALDFVNRAGELAEAQGHHPDICFGWGKVEVTIWTHKIDGLTESDFVLAAKIDRL